MPQGFFLDSGPLRSAMRNMGRRRLSSLGSSCMAACILLSAMGCRTSSRNSSVLDRAEQVRLAAADPSNYGKAVRITGVVTYCDPDWHLLFLQDASGGFFIDLKESVPGMDAGRLVEVSGKLAPSNRGIDDPDIRLLGLAPMPTPQPLPDTEVASQARLSQWPGQAVLCRHGPSHADARELHRRSLLQLPGQPNA